MEYQKRANLLDNSSNKSIYIQNKNKYYAYIVIKGNISVNNTAAAGAAANNTNKKVIFKNCATFTNCISKINNTQIDNAEYIDVEMPIYI